MKIIANDLKYYNSYQIMLQISYNEFWLYISIFKWLCHLCHLHHIFNSVPICPGSVLLSGLLRQNIASIVLIWILGIYIKKWGDGHPGIYRWKNFTIEEATNAQNNRVISTSVLAIPEKSRYVSRIQKPLSSQWWYGLVSLLWAGRRLFLFPKGSKLIREHTKTSS